jgi:hypothetical protein
MSSDKSTSVNLEDYSFTSDEESTNDSDKEMYNSVVKEKPLSELKKEEVAAILNETEEKLNQYKTSGANVPAAKEQIVLLEAKIQECLDILSSKSDSPDSEVDPKDPKGKGKAK